MPARMSEQESPTPNGTSNKLRLARQALVRVVSDPERFEKSILETFSLKKCGRPPSFDGPAPQSSGQYEVADELCLQDEINHKKSNMPLRLICTEDGKLYHQDRVEARFKEEHAQFFDPATSRSSSPTRMRDAVETSFSYAMFSHRWGEAEPLHKDLQNSDISSLTESPGTKNLQNFCRQARERGYRWAWSDTCCIDKNSTSELQKSIISMFKWYRNSALTIVYLGDVFGNSIEASTEAFMKSVWFFRGWTLQELIAPHRLVFFQSDWSLLVTSVDLPLDNYKESPDFRKLITKITGVDDDSLTKFDPAARKPNIADRMSWAAHRKTTEIEDVAYCMMGIFDVNFPVMYGEGGESAFYRLQVEIMNRSDDPSLFDWTGKPGSNSLLAASPACFDPFTIPVVHPKPVTMRLAEMLKRVPMVPQVQQQVDLLSVGFLNMQRRFGVNVQHPANFIAGAKIHCHGLEYSVLDVEEALPSPTSSTSPTSPTSPGSTHAGKSYRYHIVAESLHPITVTLGEPIKTGFGYGRLHCESMCIFRVWDQSLAVGRSLVKGDDSHPLREPFVAHLLISRPGGIYRRIQVKERMVAKLSSWTEFLMKADLRTLVIE